MIEEMLVDRGADSLRVERQPNDSILWKGREALTSTQAEEVAEFYWIVYRLAQQRPRADVRIAVIGLGFGLIVKLLAGLRSWGALDVYEIEQCIIDRWGEGHDCIVGDYRETLRGVYDTIIYDATDEIDREILREHLSPSGTVLEFGSWKPQP